MMKKIRLLIRLLTFVPMAVCIIALFFLPDEIPAHYNAAGEVDRWGSKYETLLFPGLIVVTRAVMAFMTYVATHGAGASESNRKILGYATAGILFVFDIMMLYYLYAGFAGVTELGSMPVDISQLMCIAMGIVFIALGNYLPKLRRNGVSGVRTKWSMANDEAWKLNQRFGGAAFMVDGIITIAIGVFIRGIASILVSLGLLIAAGTAMVLYSRHAYMRTQRNSGE